jgi:hypothetical protein
MAAAHFSLSLTRRHVGPGHQQLTASSPNALPYPVHAHITGAIPAVCRNASLRPSASSRLSLSHCPRHRLELAVSPLPLRCPKPTTPRRAACSMPSAIARHDEQPALPPHGMHPAPRGSHCQASHHLLPGQPQADKVASSMSRPRSRCSTSSFCFGRQSVPVRPAPPVPHAPPRRGLLHSASPHLASWTSTSDTGAAQRSLQAHLALPLAC